MIDRQSATDGDLALGDTITVLTPNPVAARLVGIATFGDDDSLGGTTLAAFGLADAQDLFLGGADQLTGLVVAGADGVDQDALVERIDGVLPDGVEAISGAELTKEQKADIEGDFLGMMTTALTVFAVVALVVAAFSIFNTFSILAAQRTRESALLRMLGASRRQVLLATLGEAVVVAVIGTGLGLGAGVLLAQGLAALLEGAGMGLPLDTTVVTSGALVAGTMMGLVVTIGAGLLPAVRASGVAPLAALREATIDATGSSRWRLLVGGIVAAAGVGTVVVAGSGDGTVPQAGLGALLVVVGVVLIGPLVARPVGRLLGAPLELRGMPGELAQRNAVRNPRRTSGTAASLLVGVGVVTLFTVFGASIQGSIEDAVDRAFGGDLVVEADGFSGSGIASPLVEAMRDRPEVAHVAGLGWGPVLLDGDDDEVNYADLASLGEVADLDVVEGSMADASRTGLAVSSDTAKDEGWALGDTVEAGYLDGASEPLTIGAIYGDRAMVGDVLLAADRWSAHVATTSYGVVLVDLADGVSLGEGRDAIEAIVADAGAPAVRDRDQFVESEASEIDTLLTVIYGLLAIAIVIALMGIANTLSLSVHERTRELGLLRAVGQTRAQVRSMVRWESVLVATFGAVGGVGVGTFLGWGLVRALNASEGLGTFRLPVGQLVVVVLVGAAAGVVAGLRPAARAARLDVLQAVATA